MQVLAGQQAQHGDLARQPQRLVPGGHEHAGPERKPGEASSDVAGEHQRARRGKVVAEVVLDEPGRGVAEAGVVLDVVEHGPVQLMVRGTRRVRRARDKAELHVRHRASPAGQGLWSEG